jgi:hypothetical protein
MFLQSRTNFVDRFLYIPLAQWHKCETALRNPLDSSERLKDKEFSGVKHF